MRIGGWERLAIVCSVSWLLAVAYYSWVEFEAVARGDAPSSGLVVLRDSKTGLSFGRLSKSEIGELANLEVQKARAEVRDLGHVTELREATPVAALVWPVISKWTFLPIAGLWIVLLAVRWVARGFRMS